MDKEQRNELIKKWRKGSKKRSKFNAKKVLYKGIEFDSQKEWRYYLKLEQLQACGAVTDIKKHIRMYYFTKCIKPSFFSSEIDCQNDIKPPKITIKKAYYEVDFIVTYKDGKIEYVDVKGMITPIFKQKKKIIEKLYGIEIILK